MCRHEPAIRWDRLMKNSDRPENYGTSGIRTAIHSKTKNTNSWVIPCLPWFSSRTNPSVLRPMIWYVRHPRDGGGGRGSALVLKYDTNYNNSRESTPLQGYAPTVRTRYIYFHVSQGHSFMLSLSPIIGLRWLQQQPTGFPFPIDSTTLLWLDILSSPTHSNLAITFFGSKASPSHRYFFPCSPTNIIPRYYIVFHVLLLVLLILLLLVILCLCALCKQKKNCFLMSMNEGLERTCDKKSAKSIPD